MPETFNVGIDEQERTVPDTPPAQTPPVLPALIILAALPKALPGQAKHPTRTSQSPSLPQQGLSNHNPLVPLRHHHTLYLHHSHWHCPCTHHPRLDYLNPGSAPHQTLSLGKACDISQTTPPHPPTRAHRISTSIHSVKMNELYLMKRGICTLNIST